MPVNFSKKRFKALAMEMLRQGVGIQVNSVDRDQMDALQEDAKLVLAVVEHLIQQTPGGDLVEYAREALGGATPQFNYDHE